MDNNSNLRKRNIAVALMVLGLMVLFFVITIIRLSQGTEAAINDTAKQSSIQHNEHGEAIVDRVVRVHFKTIIQQALPWDVVPEQEFIDIKLGEVQTVYFLATNNSNRGNTGRAIFEMTPKTGWHHITKTDCFCFSEQNLEAGETARMPTTFYIESDFAVDSMMADVNAITFSYDFDIQTSLDS